jgi:uncharacterized membrane protein
VSTAFKLLVLLHVLCIIGGFGAVAYNALYLSLAQRRDGGRGTAAVLEINHMVSGLAELLIYAAFVFGIGAVAASQQQIKFSQAWVSAAMAVYLVDIGILHGWIRPQQRRYLAAAKAVDASAAGGGAGSVDQLAAIEKRVAAGWAVFNVLVVGAVYLMVFKPGS